LYKNSVSYLQLPNALRSSVTRGLGMKRQLSSGDLSDPDQNGINLTVPSANDDFSVSPSIGNGTVSGGASIPLYRDTIPVEENSVEIYTGEWKVGMLVCFNPHLL